MSIMLNDLINVLIFWLIAQSRNRSSRLSLFSVVWNCFIKQFFNTTVIIPPSHPFFLPENISPYNDVYGTSNHAQLPTGPIDNLRGNIRITLFRGDYTLNGPEVQHLGQPTYIVPKSVMWNETNRFWEVTFSVNGFSGFF